MGSNHFLSQAKLWTVQAVILRQFYRWLKPELGLPVTAVYVHVSTWFLPREKVEPEATLAQNCWAHASLDLFFTADARIDRAPAREARRERHSTAVGRSGRMRGWA